MSIIHDALKKVQQKTSPEEKNGPLSLNEPVLASSGSSEANRPGIILLVSVISIAVAILSTVLWYLARETKTSVPKAASVVQSSPVPAAKAADVAAPVQPKDIATEKPALPTTSELGAALVSTTPRPVIDPNDPLASLRIQGIMDMGGKTVALINDNIYEEGQTIHGKIIARITIDGVTILDGENKRTFPVNPPKP